MHQSVAHTDYVIPWDARHLSSGGWVHLMCSFANNFDRLDQRQNELTVATKIVTGAAMDKTDNLVRGIQNVAQPDQIIRPHTEPLLQRGLAYENTG